MAGNCDLCGEKLGFRKFHCQDGVVCKKCYAIVSNGFSETIAKKTLAELLLYDWFRAARMLHAPFCIMIDEVQNLSAGPNSVLGQIISEGRKFGIGTILLSQTLKGFSPEERVCISQSRYQLVFRPPMAEIRSFAEMLSDSQHRAETLELLKSLDVGQCLLSGPVYIGDDPQPCTDCIKITVDLSEYD